MTALVIRGLGLIVGKMVKDDGAVSAVKAISAISKERRFIPTTLVTRAAQSLIEAYEIDINPEIVTTRRVGKTLTKMRFASHRPTGRSGRGWVISLDDVIRWAKSYGLDPSEITGIKSGTLFTNGTNGSNGTYGTKL